MSSSGILNDTTKYSGRKEIIIVSIVFIIALLIRLRFAWPLFDGEQEFMMGDDDDYYRLGLSLMNRGSLEDGGFFAYRMPIFPIFLAIIFKLFGPSTSYATLVIILLSSLICVGTYYLGKSVFNPIIGLAASLIIAFDTELIIYSSFLLTEIPFVFMVLCCFLALNKFHKSPNFVWSLIVGLLLGITTLIRVNFGVIIPFLIIFLYLDSKSSKINISKYLALILFLIGAMWLSWVSRNYVISNSFIPFTTQGGNAYFGVYNDIVANESNPLRFGHWIGLEIPERISHLDEFNADRELKLIAKTWFYKHPTQGILIALSQLFHLWRPQPIGEIGISYGLIILLSVYGYIKSNYMKSFQIRLWTLLFFSFSIAAIATIAVPRFNLVFHPYLAILASFGLLSINKSLVKKFRGRN